MTDDKPESPPAKIFRKPIHDQATRKVSALPNLLRRSERPDGEKATKVQDKDDATTVEHAPTEIDDGGLFDDLFEE